MRPDFFLVFLLGVAVVTPRSPLYELSSSSACVESHRHREGLEQDAGKTHTKAQSQATLILTKNDLKLGIATPRGWFLGVTVRHASTPTAYSVHSSLI